MVPLVGEPPLATVSLGTAFLGCLVIVVGLGWWVLRGDRRNRAEMLVKKVAPDRVAELITRADLDFIYLVARGNLSDQLQQLAAVDSKLGVLLIGGTTLVALNAAAFRFDTHRAGIGATALFVVAASSYVVLLFSTLRGLLARELKAGPNLNWILNRAADGQQKEVKLSVIKALRDSYEVNRAKSRQKLDDMRRGTWALAVVGVAVVASLLTPST